MKKNDYELMKTELMKTINFGFSNFRTQKTLNKFTGKLNDIEYNKILKKLHKDKFISIIALKESLVKIN